jgi:hypothetical protein
LATGGGISTVFTTSGPRVQLAGTALDLHLAGIGRGTHVSRVGAAKPAASGSKVSYRHPGITEWYKNGPRGLEQGFTLARRPGGSGWITVAVGAPGPFRLSRQGGSIAVRSSAGGPSLARYGALSAVDAAGRPMASRLELRNGAIRLEVDDTGARYPLTIDPFLQLGSKLAIRGTNSDGAFGFSVAVSANGTTAMVGGHNENSGIGAVWAFTHVDGDWIQQGSMLLPSDGTLQPRFGTSVSLSSDGNTAVIGGRGDDSVDGAAWIFTRSEGVWSQFGPKLFPDELRGQGGAFGQSVALSGDGTTAIVGAPGAFLGTGRVVVYKLTDSNVWAQQGSELAPLDEANQAEFGTSLALNDNGTIALIGGPFDTRTGTNDWKGAAWIFASSDGDWSQQGPKIVPSDAEVAHFGYSLAMSSNASTLLIGGPADQGAGTYEAGAAWIYERTGNTMTWTQLGTKLQPADSTGVGAGPCGPPPSFTGPCGARFGYSVSVSSDGTGAVIGGPNENQGSGAAWIYHKLDGVWQEQSKLLAGDSDNSSGAPVNFGSSVALFCGQPCSADGATALVGGPGDSTNGGAAWFFTQSGNNWSQLGSKRTGVSQERGAGAVGSSVAVSSNGSTALVGAPSDDGQKGAVWVFVKSGSGWTQQGTKLVAPDAAPGDLFGSSVALSLGGETALIGEYGAHGAWVFRRVNGAWAPDAPLASIHGASVALSDSGDTALIGDPSAGSGGTVLVFTHTTGSWQQQGPALAGGVSSTARFGERLALSGSGDTALIGAPGDTTTWLYTRSSAGVWSQGAELRAYGANLGYGGALALSGDGKTALIGYGKGAFIDHAYAFARAQNGTWPQQGDLVSTGADTDPDFGTSVALSWDGDTALIGGPSDNDDVGAVWKFTRSSSGNWSQAGNKVTANDEAASGGFGTSVALSGDGVTAFVGGPGDNVSAGAAWVLSQGGGAGSQPTTKLIAIDESGNAQFGINVSLSADGMTALIGGPFDSGSGTFGAAWIFTRVNNIWTQTQKLTVPGPVAVGFGQSVALSGDGTTALIGAPSGNQGVGEAWVFTPSGPGGTWVPQGPSLVVNDCTGQTQCEFGWSVALSNNGSTALIGGPLDVDAQNHAMGAAWVFTRANDNTWSRQGPKLTPNDPGQVAPEFGTAVSLSGGGDTALIGGPLANSGPQADTRGGAWTFTRSPVDASWSQNGAMLAPVDESGQGQFGASVALSNDASTALIGGPQDAVGTGAAWVFTKRQSGLYVQQGPKLFGPGPTVTAGAQFGSGVALSEHGDTALVGAQGNAGSVGAAWTFARSQSGDTWSPDGPALTPSFIMGGGPSFGASVSLSFDGSAALVGGPNDGGNVGAAWVFSGGAEPGAPTDATAVAGDGQATVSFTPPSSNGGRAITSYTVVSSPGGIQATGAGSPISVTGLDNDTPYTFTVTATNAVGTGPASDPSNEVTPMAGIPTLTADSPSAAAGAARVNPGDIPSDSIPLQTLAQASAPLHEVGLQGSPLHEIPLHEIGLSASGGALTKVLLSEIPLLNTSWQQLLAGTGLAESPLQGVTFGQALEANPVGVGSITLSQIDLSASPLHEVGLAAIVLGGIPLHEIPLHEVSGGPDPLTAWCNALSGPPIGCTDPTTLSDETVLSLAIKGAPLHEIPLHEIPLHEIPLHEIPLDAIPLHEIDIADSPLHEIPLHEIGNVDQFVDCNLVLSCTSGNVTLGDAAAAGAIKRDVPYVALAQAIPLHEIPLHEIPLHEVPLHEVPLHEVVLANTPLHEIPLHEIPLHEIGNLVDCDHFQGYCIANTSKTLGDAVDEAALLPGVSLADVAAFVSTPLHEIPLHEIPLHEIDIASSPLHEIPLHEISNFTSIVDCLGHQALCNDPGTTLGDVENAGAFKDGTKFSQLLAAIPLHEIPLNDPPLSVTCPTCSTLGDVPLHEIPLHEVPLHEIPLHEVAIAGAPLHEVPLRQIPLQEIGNVVDCDHFHDFCTAATTATIGDANDANALLPGVTLGDVAPFLSIPLHEVRLDKIPLHEIDIAHSPLHEIPLHEIPLRDTIVDCGAYPSLCSSPTATLGDAAAANALIGTFADLAAAIPIGSVPVNEIPLNAIPLHEIPLHEVNVIDSPLHEIKLQKIADKGADLARLIDCDTYTEFCLAGTTKTLGDVAIAGAFRPEATLDELVPYLPDDFTFGDLLVAMIDPNTFPWEQLPYTTMNVQSFAKGGGVLPYTLSFAAPGATAAVTVTMPPGAIYKAGTATFGPTAGSQGAIPDPTVNGSQLSWSLPSLTPATAYKLHFSLDTSLQVGQSAATATVADIQAAPAGATILETNAGHTAVTDPLAIDPGQVYFGYVAQPGEVHYYSFAAPPLGSRVTVRLSNVVDADNDLVVYTPAGSHIKAADGIPVQNGPVDDTSAGQAAEQALQDVPVAQIPGDEVAGISATSGDQPENIDLTSAGTGGDFVIQVSGYNGKTSDMPYTLRVEVDPPLTPPACQARTLSQDGTPGAFPSQYDSNLNTLFVVDAKRIGDTYGTEAESNVMSALNNLVSTTGPALGVNGAVVPVESDPTVRDGKTIADAYDAWDANPCSPDVANGVAGRISSLIDSVHKQRPSLKYIVLVGGDDIVPMVRIPDNTQVANEAGFASTFLGDGATTPLNNEYYGSLAARYLLSDTPYGTPDAMNGPAFARLIYVPSLSVGRLVETPDQITGALSQFVSSNGTLHPSTTLTTGYDFLAAGADRIATTFQSRYPGRASSLISQNWTRNDLLDGLSLAPTPNVVALNAHANTQQILPAGGNPNVPGSLVSYADLPGAPGSLAGQIWFSRLMSLFAGDLDGTLTIGQAWTKAINDYWGNKGPLTPYDEKVMEEATLYGLPFYGVGNQPSAVVRTIQSARVAATTAAATLEPDPLSGLQSQTFTLHPTQTLRNVGDGTSYYEGDDVIGVNGEPLIPSSTQDFTSPDPDQVLHGLLITTPLTSEPHTGFHAAFSHPVVDNAADEPATPTPGAVFPSTIASIRNVGPASAPERQTGVFATGQFTSGDEPGVGNMRLWTEISGLALYAPAASTDFTPPSIASSTATTDGTNVTFAVDATDPDDTVKFVYVLYRDASGTWQATTLTEGLDGSWAGTAAADGDQVEFFVQVGDTNGNIAVSTNKALYFDAQGTDTITLTGDTAPDGSYTGPVHVAASSSINAALRYALDGGDPTDYSQTFTVSSGGFHTVDVTGADGSQASASFTIIGAAPVITVSVPGDGSSYLLGSSHASEYSCTGSGAGVASCVGSVPNGAAIDTSTVGTKTFTVTATDSNGVTSTTTVTYAVTAPANLDTTAPTVSCAAADGAWHNTNVLIPCAATDSDSGLVDQADASFTLTTHVPAGTSDPDATATGITEVCDVAGNCSPVAPVTGNKVDQVPPSISGSASPAANSAGWRNTDVTVTFSCSDADSGVVSCGDPVTLGEGAGQSASGTATDNAGNTASATVSGIDVDETPPSLHGSPTTSPNAHGWYSGNVTIQWTCSDALSGIAGSCPGNDTITGEGIGLTADETVSDRAGNSTDASSAPLRIDRTAPATTASAPAGWSNAPVTVTLHPVDALSGVDATYYTVDGGTQQAGTSIAISSEGTHTISYWSVDNAGNTEPANAVSVMIDQTPPQVSCGSADSAWHKTNVSIGCTASDALSHLADPGDASFTLSTSVPAGSADANASTGTHQVCDQAGNCVTAGPIGGNKIDRVLPTITGSAAPAPNGSGWNNTDVTVTFTCSDAHSGIATCPGPTTLHEGANQSVSGTATDNAGNTASATVSAISVDETPPSLHGNPTTSPNANGWYSGDVTITWTCSDALSGIAGACPADDTLTGEGTALTATRSVSDRAGNTATASSAPVKIDRTPPQTTVAGVPAGWSTGPVTLTLTPTDALSGVAQTYYVIDSTPQQPGTSIAVSGEGSHAVSFWSVDKAGNTETLHTVTVLIDTTPPVINCGSSDGAWHSSNVSISCTAFDPGSGLASLADLSFSLTTTVADASADANASTGTRQVCDAVGNCATAGPITGNLIDRIIPSITGSAAPASNGNGWNNTDVVVGFTCSDGDSGIATCPVQTTLHEGANQHVTGTATDVAGNHASATVSGINVDETPPVLHGTPTSSPNAHGWYSGDVTIHWTCSDALSGIQGSCPGDDTIHGEGASLTQNESVTDKADNTTAATSAPAVRIDRTAPITTTDAPIGWTGHTTFGLSPSDNLSGIDATFYTIDGGPTHSGTSVTISSNGTHTISFWSSDLAGNVESPKTVTVMIDAPTIVHQLSPQPNAAGWNRSDVTVTFVCSAASGIQSCTSPQTVSHEGALQAVVGHAVSTVGTTADDTALVSLDKTPPHISADADRSPNSNGWYNAQVKISFTCTDSLSGVASCPGARTLDQGVGQSVSGSAFDAAGNDATTTLGPINVDETAPVVSVTGVVNGAVYLLGSVPTAGCQTVDALSGVATSATVSLTGGPTGKITALCSGGSDKAGNTAAAVSATYTVATKLGGGTTSCNGTYGGSGSNVTIPAGAVCTLVPGTALSGNVTVQQGGTLKDLGATITGNLQANSALAIQVSGGSVANLLVASLTGKPAGADNSLCNLTVTGNAEIRNLSRNSPIDIGNLGACAGGPGLNLIGSLSVHDNAGPILVGGNHAGTSIDVRNNTGGGVLTGNSAGTSCSLKADTPGITGSGNTAGSTNTCNSTA